MSKRSPKWVQKYIEKIATSIVTNPASEQILKTVSSIIQEAFFQLESCWCRQIKIQDLRFTSRVSQDLDKYKSKTCQTVILAKEQQAANGDIIFWYISDPSNTPNGKSYSGDATCIDIIGYKKWLWNKIKILLANTYYFSDIELGMLEKTINFDKAINFDPSSPDPYAAKGVIYAKLRKYEESLAMYDKALELDKNDIDAIYNKYLTLQFLNRFQEARDCYLRYHTLYFDLYR